MLPFEEKINSLTYDFQKFCKEYDISYILPKDISWVHKYYDVLNIKKENYLKIF